MCGIKFDSVFNQLIYSHVCLFEGVVSCDLALCINHLVNKEKHFTYVELNRSISQFTYLGYNADDKPPEFCPNSEKLSGHAVQNWCLLRVLPLLVEDRIKNPTENSVWKLILLLREIVVHVCVHHLLLLIRLLIWVSSSKNTFSLEWSYFQSFALNQNTTIFDIIQSL